MKLGFDIDDTSMLRVTLKVEVMEADRVLMNSICKEMPLDTLQHLLTFFQAGGFTAGVKDGQDLEVYQSIACYKDGLLQSAHSWRLFKRQLLDGVAGEIMSVGRLICTKRLGVNEIWAPVEEKSRCEETSR